MKRRLLVVTVAIGFLTAASVCLAEQNPLKNAKCPVSGKPVKASVSTKYKGGKVYFCCPKCCGRFVKAKQKYAAKANLQLVATGQAKLVRCPFSCKELDPETAIDVQGVKVCFCCQKCKKKACSAKDTVACVFNNKAFKRGFELVKKKKEKK